MKVIFLDIDGVLNNHDSLVKGVHILPEKVLLIKEICQTTQARVVISSTWRVGQSVANLSHLLWRVGLGGVGFKPIIDFTPVLNQERGKEIDEWLSRNEVESFIIIDDEEFDIHQKDRLVLTNSEFGITGEDTDKAIEMLSHLSHYN